MNLPNAFGYTPLHLAVGNNNLRALRLLLQSKRIDVNRANWLDVSPLIMAVKLNRYELAEALLRHPDIDLNVVDADGMRAADHALKSRDTRIRELFTG